MMSATTELEIETLSKLGEQLIDAIISDEHTEVIIRIIDSDAPLWYQNEDEGMSPLHAAAYRQNTKLAKLLIDRGAVWNAGKFYLALESRRLKIC